MKTIYLILILFSITITDAFAERLKGRVVDDQNEGIDFATLVLQNSDSTFYSSTFSNENGYFEFESYPEGAIFIAQHIQYETLFGEVQGDNPMNLTMKSKAVGLDEIVISAERPLIKVEGSKLIYDAVQLSEGRAVTSAYQVLTDLPGVIEMNGALTLAGTNGLNIIINGKLSSMSQEQLIDLLKSMPKEQIKKLEVMYNTPPEYHVKGASINLILVGTTNEGQELIQGLLSGEYEQKFYSNYKTTGNFRYANHKLALDILYSFKDTQERPTNDIYANHTVNNVAHDIFQKSVQHLKANTHQVRIAADYNFSEQNKLNLTYTLEDKPWINSFGKSSGTFAESYVSKENITPTLLNNFSLSFNTFLNTSLSIDYTTFRSKQLQTNRYASTSEVNLASFLKQNINQLNISIDQSQEINGWELGYGASMRNSRDEGIQSYILSPEAGYSDAYDKQKESSYTLYAGFEKILTDKLSLAAYLNAEYFKRGDVKQWNIYPIVNISYMPSASHIVQFGLSADKTYPNFWSLTNTISHMDDYIEIHGNPNLVPSRNYDASLTYIFKNRYIVGLNYSYENDYFAQLPYMPSNKLSLIYQTQNWDYRQKLSMNLIVPFSLSDIMKSNLTLVGEYQKAKSNHFFDVPFSNSRFVPYFILNNTFKLPFCPSFSFELNTIALGKSTQGAMDINSLWKMDAGASWTFAKEKASLRVKATDIWKTWKPDVSMNHFGQTLKMDNYDDVRGISLAFTYKFGGYKEKKQKEIDTSRFGTH